MNVAYAHDGVTFKADYMSEGTHDFDMAKETLYMSERTVIPLALRGAAPRPVLVAATTSGAGLARRAATLHVGAP